MLVYSHAYSAHSSEHDHKLHAHTNIHEHNLARTAPCTLTNPVMVALTQVNFVVSFQSIGQVEMNPMFDCMALTTVQVSLWKCNYTLSMKTIVLRHKCSEYNQQTKNTLLTIVRAVEETRFQLCNPIIGWVRSFVLVMYSSAKMNRFQCTPSRET